MYHLLGWSKDSGPPIGGQAPAFWWINSLSDIAYYNSKNSIIPVHISEDVSSLSAIALDEDFYDFMMKGRKVVDNTQAAPKQH